MMSERNNPVSKTERLIFRVQMFKVYDAKDPLVAFNMPLKFYLSSYCTDFFLLTKAQLLV